MNKIMKNIACLLAASMTFISCGNSALTGTNSGSLVDDRSSDVVMTFMLLFVVLILVISLIFVVSKKIVAYKNSPEHLERQKKRPTSTRDIAEVAREASLSKKEKDLLWKICKTRKTPNVIYFVKETDDVEKLLKEEYNDMKTTRNEELIATLFSLRLKLLRAYKQVIVLRNTKVIETGTLFTFTQSKGFHYKLKLVDTNSDNMTFTLPKALSDSNDLPAALSKVSMVFEDKDFFPYEIETRIVRYEDGNGEEKRMITVHTDKIVPLKKRQTERIEIQAPCTFYSAKKQGKNEADAQYEVSEKEHEGTLEDVSMGGCRVITSLPIKAEQYLEIKGPMNKTDIDTAIGVIVRTTKRVDNNFILHVRFVKIGTAVKNKIQAIACGYEE
ncbi:MAG: PilZ domain-containing protein [Treponema sp.]|nr:PilZ domain-containing protein [Treponema sp.]